MAVTAKISALSGPHCGDAVEYAFQGWRQPLSWERRMDEWVADTNTFGADIAINFGDTVESNTTDSLKLGFLNDVDTSYLATVTNAVTGFQCPRLDVLGNHIGGTPDEAYAPLWDGTGDKPSMTDYFDNIGDQTSGQSVTKENFFVPTDGIAGKPYGYTADVGGVRYIIAYMPRGGTVSANVLTWIETWIADSTIPVVVCSHAHLWEDTNHTLTNEWRANDASLVSLYAIYDAYPLVQLVLGGHKHEHARHWKKNGIHYLSVGGSVGIPYEGWVGNNNNYAMITMNALSVPTPFGMKADLTVVGTGYPATHCSVTPEVFGVM